MNPADLDGIPDGALVRLTVEGRLARGVGHSISIWADMPDRHASDLLVFSARGATDLLSMATAVDVLPEPVIEPTGDWAVVLDRHGHPWVRHPPSGAIYTHHWQSGQGSGAYRWDRLVEGFGPLKVVFEGVNDD